MELTLKDRKAIINTGELSPQEQPLQERMNPVGALLGSTTGESTLADRKAIHNLPKFERGKPFFEQVGNWISGAAKDVNTFANKDNKMFGTNANAMLSSGIGAVDFVGGIANAGQYNTTADDALMDAGTSTGNIGGINYTRQNDVNASQISALTGAENTANTVGLMGKGASLGASVGSVAGPVGSLIGGAVGAIGGIVGGLFGGAARKRKMRQMIAEAKDKAFRQNDFSRSGALTSVLQQQYAQQYGDTESQSLYGFVNGKQSFSAAGPTEGYNARVSSGEIIANKFTGEMFRVPGLPNNKDGKLALIRPTDTIITNKYGLSDYVAETGDLEGGEAMMSSIMKAKGKQGYKCGKLPGYVNGLPELVNSIVNLGGATLAGLDANRIRNQAISNPNFRENLQNRPRIDAAMLSRHENPYPIMEQYYNSLAKQKYNLRNTYGLSQAQMAMMDASAEQQARESMGRLLTEQQRSNNAMIADAARLMAQEDATQAELNFNANKSRYDAYNQSHGAREMMASQRQADMMNFAEQWSKGLTDLHMWRRMMYNWDRDYNADHPSVTQTYPSFGIDKATRNYISGVKPDEEQDFWDEFKRFGRIPTASYYVPNYKNIPVPNFSFPKLIKTSKKRK